MINIDLSFLDKIETVNNSLSISIVVTSIVFIVIASSYIFYRKILIYVSIVSCVIGIISITVLVPISNNQEEVESKDHKVEEIIKSINQSYNIRITESDSILILERYNNNNPHEYSKLYANKASGEKLSVIHYIIRGSRLEFYNNNGNGTFSKIEPVKQK